MSRIPRHRRRPSYRRRVAALPRPQAVALAPEAPVQSTEAPVQPMPVAPVQAMSEVPRLQAPAPVALVPAAALPGLPAAPALVAPPPAPARRAAADPAALAALLRRGEALLAIGDVSGARRFFERVAEAGDAAGARAMGRTYDPAVLGEPAGLGHAPRTRPPPPPGTAARRRWRLTGHDGDRPMTARRRGLLTAAPGRRRPRPAAAQGAGQRAAPGCCSRSTPCSARANAGTVGVIAGGIDGTYARIAADLAAVLDEPDGLRVLPILGKGSVQNISDILALRGVDVGIVQSDVLAYARRERCCPASSS